MSLAQASQLSHRCQAILRSLVEVLVYSFRFALHFCSPLERTTRIVPPLSRWQLANVRLQAREPNSPGHAGAPWRSVAWKPGLGGPTIRTTPPGLNDCLTECGHRADSVGMITPFATRTPCRNQLVLGPAWQAVKLGAGLARCRPSHRPAPRADPLGISGPALVPEPARRACWLRAASALALTASARPARRSWTAALQVQRPRPRATGLFVCGLRRVRGHRIPAQAKETPAQPCPPPNARLQAREPNGPGRAGAPWRSIACKPGLAG